MYVDVYVHISIPLYCHEVLSLGCIGAIYTSRFLVVVRGVRGAMSEPQRGPTMSRHRCVGVLVSVKVRGSTGMCVRVRMGALVCVNTIA